MPIVWTFRPDAYFHEFVLFECGIERGNDSVGKAKFAKLYERIEMMSERSQVSSLLSRKAHMYLRAIAIGDRKRFVRAV